MDALLLVGRDARALSGEEGLHLDATPIKGLNLLSGGSQLRRCGAAALAPQVLLLDPRRRPVLRWLQANQIKRLLLLLLLRKCSCSGSAAA
jgi:hypothetical protein